jgi:hypothetical protein
VIIGFPISCLLYSNNQLKIIFADKLNMLTFFLNIRILKIFLNKKICRKIHRNDFRNFKGVIFAPCVISIRVPLYATIAYSNALGRVRTARWGAFCVLPL